MFSGYDIKQELLKYKVSAVKPEDEIIIEANKILKQSIFKEQNILSNLKTYNKSFQLLDEVGLDEHLIFTTEEIRKICIKFRLKFLNSQNYHFDIPYEVILKIKDLNRSQKKDLDGFQMLGVSETFKRKSHNANFVLFVPTIYGNYYLLHSWGTKLTWYKKLLAFPLRSFESLAVTLLVLAFMITLSLPTCLITLDKTATYWCGYRIATYFHLLIFFSGVSAYILVGFNKRFSGQVWQQEREFD